MTTKTCNNIGCNNPRHPSKDYCSQCLGYEDVTEPAMSDLDVCTQMGKSAKDFLARAAATQDERGKEYDAEGGERSMRKVVMMFNALTDANITETDGWRFMEILKMVRAQGKYHEDSCIDSTSFAALAAESSYREAHLH